MERIRFVKTLQGEIIDLTIPPLEDHHYIFDGVILWAAPDDITLGMVDAVNCGTVIAQSSTRKPLEEFCMPIEFFRFQQWCRSQNVRPCNGSSILTYFKHYVDKNTIKQKSIMV